MITRKLDALRAALTWPVVALLLGGGVVFALVAIFAPEGARELLFGAHGLIATLVALYLRSPREGSSE